MTAQFLPFDFGPVRNVLQRCAAEGVTLRYWWRDDDATRATPSLERLLALSHATDVPVALAVVPARAEPSLRDRIENAPGIDVLVHGLSHVNHAPNGIKKSEFGATRPLEALVADANTGLQTLSAMMRSATLPVFVPPWNRIADDLVPLLGDLGYRGISTFGPALPAPAGLIRVNAHLDPIAWKAGGGLADPTAIVEQIVQAILSRLAAPAGNAEPIGLLTHHLVHDEEIWRFIAALLDTLRSAAAARPMRATDLFTSGPA